MCHYITAILPQSVDVKAIKPIFKIHGLGFKKVDNLELLEQLELGDTIVLTTTSHCDCGTALGTLRRQTARQTKAKTSEAKIRKLKKQGWSETRIEKWLEEKMQNDEKRQNENELRFESDANHWVEFINDILHSKQTNRVSILIHFYSGNIETEEIELVGKEKVKLERLNSQFLGEIEEDVVYEFTY